MLPSIARIAELLGGDVSGGQVLCPGPGHTAADRSLSIKLDSGAPDGFVLHSFAGDDAIACRDYVRDKVGLPPFEATKKKKKPNGGAQPFSPTVAKYVYRLADGKPYLQVQRTAAKEFPQYHWDGEKWISGKPQGPKVPYRLPELNAAAPTTPVYIVEGEKDVDSLAKIGFVATTASEGAKAKWAPELTPYFKDRHVVILPDADKPGREHAQKVAGAINDVAASVRILDLYPERHDGSDVSNWLVDDTAGAKLAKLAKKAPLWEAGDPPPPPPPPGDDIEIEITRLAKLKPLDYDRERKEAGKRLGITRLSTLDLVVKAKRTELGLDGGGDGMQGQAISFPEPEPWPEPVDGAALLDQIATAIRKHVVLSDHARDAAALWVAHTYLVNCFFISPRAGVCSPVKGCAKSLLLDVFAHLVWRAQLTANVTPAAVFRVIEAHQPTLLIDEADTFLHDNDGLRGVLNGNRKSSKVLRTVGDQHEVRAFATYSACAIALIGKLPDTLHDRAIRIDLKRRLRSEKVEPYRPDRAGHLDVLARKAVRWAQDNAEAIANADPKMPDDIINREADNWRPLVAIADAVDGTWPDRARKAAEAAHVAGGGDEASQLELLLSDIRAAKWEKRSDLLRVEHIEITSAELVKTLVALDGRPWAEMGKARKPMTQNRLARMLKPLGIGPGEVGPEDGRLRGYALADFNDAFERYVVPLPDEGAPQPSIRPEVDEIRTSGISQPSSPDPGWTVGKCEKPNNDGLLDGWTVAKGGPSEKTHVRTAKSRSDDLPYTGPVVAVPDHGPDPLDEHGVPVAATGDPSLCTYCGRPGGNRIAMDGDEVCLHRECEHPYFDRLAARGKGRLIA